jgi:hypothetical protein
MRMPPHKSANRDVRYGSDFSIRSAAVRLTMAVFIVVMTVAPVSLAVPVAVDPVAVLVTVRAMIIRAVISAYVAAGEVHKDGERA